MLPLDLPPLRARGQDPVLLFQRFLHQRRPRGWVPPLGEASKKALLAHPWPGNLRALMNAAERTLLPLDHHVQTLDPQHLVLDGVAAPPMSATGLVNPLGKTLEQIEKEAIALVMREHQGNRKEAAAQLGISATTLLEKLRDYGLEGEGKS